MIDRLEWGSPRSRFGKILVELGRSHPDVVVLDADVSSSTQTSRFAQEFPARFVNVGVAEQDLMGTAAGLAAYGKIAFVSTFAVFATGRAWEQVRDSICFPRRSVKIVATHGGLSVGPDGATHQANEDLALMRVLPHTTVIVPCDCAETEAAVRAAYEIAGPFYVRLSRNDFPVGIPGNEGFTVGRGKVLREGRDLTVISCGYLIPNVLRALEEMGSEADVRLINMPTLKPIDAELIERAARETGSIVTVEEHSIIGGLGSAVAEVLVERCPVPMLRLGVRDRFGTSGAPDELFHAYGLSPSHILDAIRKTLAMRVEGRPKRS